MAEEQIMYVTLGLDVGAVCVKSIEPIAKNDEEFALIMNAWNLFLLRNHKDTLARKRAIPAYIKSTIRSWLTLFRKLKSDE
jgi:hypothetical protein